MTAEPRTIAELLDEVHRTPLGELTAEQAGAIVGRVLPKRATDTAVVVAAFGSSI